MIELFNLTKSYPTPLGRRYVFRDLSFRFPDDVSIGLIGPNGAGKSTLMRMLGGIDSPDRGRVQTNMRISWPVGLGGAFQPSLTGRDNVRFVSRVYGATGAAMRKKIAFVEEFAEIGEYFDQPIKMYSSGMRSRLAFGLSMAFDFDYYLIDEVMAVGDARFREKCSEVFKERLKKSKLILVSHSMRDIVQLCDVVVLVEKGQVKIFEDVKEGVAAYQGDTVQPAPAEGVPVPKPIVFPPHIVTRTQANRYIGYLSAGHPPATKTDGAEAAGDAAQQQAAPKPIVFPPYVTTRTQAARYLGYLAAEAEAEKNQKTASPAANPEEAEKNQKTAPPAANPEGKNSPATS